LTNSQKISSNNFRHSGFDPESSIFETFWTPAFAGVTAAVIFCERVKVREGKYEFN
jgi:hypothetical protein